AFARGWDVRAQGPIALDDESEPEPDVAVVRGSAREYRDSHPAAAGLVVEVAVSRLATDRGGKARLYARARIAAYWMVTLVDRVIEVHRHRVADRAAPIGWRYRSVTTVGSDGSIVPLAAQASRILVADLLP